MNRSLAIWHPDGADRVLLRTRLQLADPCRGGRLRCAAAGGLQVYFEGVRVAGTPTPGLCEGEPLWMDLELTGSWESGEHELLVEVAAGPTGRWFRCQGELDAVGAGESYQWVTGIHWQSCLLPDPPPDADEAYSAFEDRRNLGPWEGTEEVSRPEPRTTARRASERMVFGAKLPLLGEIASAEASTFQTVVSALKSCKCVHSEGLLGSDNRVPRVRTSERGDVLAIVDLGREVLGTPFLRLRQGEGGVVEITCAPAWGEYSHRLRHICGQGRQEWFGLTMVRARYLLVRFRQFVQDADIESIGICERSVVALEESSVQISEGYDRVWALGSTQLSRARQEAFVADVEDPGADWLPLWALVLNECARTGDLTTAGHTLSARAPANPSRPQSLAFPQAVLAYLRWTDDRERVATLLDRCLEVTAAEASPREPAWSPVAVAAVQAGAAVATKAMCEALGRVADGAVCDEAVTAAQERAEPFWDASQSLFVGDDRARLRDNALALLWLVENERAVELTKALSKGNSSLSSTGTLDAFVLVEALWRWGHRTAALDVLKTHWIRPTERAAEQRIQRLAPRGAALGADHFFGAHLIGYSPGRPPRETRNLRPALSLIRLARARLLTPQGATQIAWRPRDEEDGLSVHPRTSIELSAEGDVETRLALERGERKMPTVAVNGSEIWRNEKLFPNARVHEMRADESTHLTLCFALGGDYQITLE